MAGCLRSSNDSWQDCLYMFILFTSMNVNGAWILSMKTYWPQSHLSMIYSAFLTVSSWSFGRAEPYRMVSASVGFLTFFFPSVFFGFRCFSVASGSFTCLTSLALAASAFWPALASDLLAFNEPRYSDAWSVKPTSDSRSSARCWALLVLESSLMASSSFGWAPHKITTGTRQAYYIFISTVLKSSTCLWLARFSNAIQVVCQIKWLSSWVRMSFRSFTVF